MSKSGLSSSKDVLQDFRRESQKGFKLIFHNEELSDELRLDRFKTWLKDNRVILKSLSVQSVSKGEMNGLVAIEDIKRDDLVIQVPRSAMITQSDAMRSPIHQLFKSLNYKPPPNIVLALFVLQQRLSNVSRWKPYLDILPRSFSHVLFYSDDEFKLLESSLLFDSIVPVMKNLLGQFWFIKDQLQKSSSSDLEELKEMQFLDFLWAVCVLMTRQNLIPSKDGESSEPALIPGWDMANHESFDEIKTEFHAESDCILSFSGRDFRAGEEYKMCYGHRSTAELFFYSGFVIHNSADFNYLDIFVHLEENDKLFQKRLQVLALFSIGEKVMLYSHPLGSRKNSDVRMALLVKYATESELYAVSPENIMFSDVTTSNALRWLQIKLQVTLKRIDLAVNQAKGKLSDQHQAIHYLREETRLISEILANLSLS